MRFSSKYEIRLTRDCLRAVIGHRGDDTDIPAFLRTLGLACVETGTRCVVLVVAGSPIRDHGLDPDALYRGVHEMLRARGAWGMRLAIVVSDPLTRRVYRTLSDAAQALAGDGTFGVQVFSGEEDALAWLGGAGAGAALRPAPKSSRHGRSR